MIRPALRSVLLLAFVALAVTHWPASLGGDTRLVVVRGSSMEPTYALGDVLVVREDSSPRVGDAIVFRIPADEPGAGGQVVHRIVGIRDDGSFLTQGDNRTTADPFHVRARDVIGVPRWTIPRAGRLVGVIGSPLVVGVAAGIAMMILVKPTRRPRGDVPALSDAPCA